MTFKNKSFMIKKKAFTLIELLIVIAIIGILFIVLISKVDFATDKAKATGVQTDFRSFQLAFDTVAKENAGFNTFGWDTGDANQNGKRDSYDEGDSNKDGVRDDGEIWTGHKVYDETFTKVFSLKKNGTGSYDREALNRLETAINANLDPKLHITIKDDGEIVMANGAQDPWNKEYHGWYITNAETDGLDRGAIVIYSDGANGEFGSEHKIANGVVSISIPGNNKYGKDDYSIASCYTYVNGYGEVLNITTGFSNNQNFKGVSGNNVSIVTPDDTDDNTIDLTSPDLNLDAGLYDSKGQQLASWDELVTIYGVKVNKNYTNTTYLTETTSLYSVINNNLEKFNSGVVLVIGNDVTTIGQYALAGCENLINITVPDNVTRIDQYALMGCNNLTTLTVPFIGRSANETYYDHFGYWFANNSYNNQNDTIPMTLSTVKITNDPTINSSGFYGCQNITNIILTNTAIKIGSYAFYRTGISNITIPNSVTTIDHSAFAYCDNLQSITIGTGLTSMGGNVAEGSNNLEVVNISDLNQWLGLNVTSRPLMSTAQTLLLNGEEITGEIVIPDHLTIIPSYALTNTKITKVIMHDGITSVGSHAFAGCENLTELTMPNSVTSIGSGVIRGCNNLTTLSIPFVGLRPETTLSVYSGLEELFRKSTSSGDQYDYEIPDSLKTVIVTNTTHIVSFAFNGCSSIENIILPSMLTNIGMAAFQNCTNLTNIVIPDSVTTIEQGAFANCKNLTSIVLPQNITKIESQTFSGCTGLTDITISDGMTCIGYESFSGCTSLTTITLPNSITTIEREVFEGAKNLTEVRFAGTREQWNSVSKGANWSWTKGDVSLKIICADEIN